MIESSANVSSKKKVHGAGFSSLITRFCCTVKPPKKPPPPPPAATEEIASTSAVPAAPAAPSRSSNEMHRVFCYFDENGDGKISATELRSCMRAIGEEVSDEDAAAVLQATDSDGDGMLGYDDFVMLVEGEAGEHEKEQNLRAAFRVYEEGEGCITPRSLHSALSRLGEAKSVEECRLMIRRYDINGDGVITFDEFRIMML